MKLGKNSIILIAVILVLIVLGLLLLWFNFPPEEKITNFNLMTPQEKMDAEVLSLAKDYTFNISEIESVEKIKAYGLDVIPVLAEMIKNPRKETRYIAYIALSGLTNRLPDKRSELISYLKTGLTDTDDTIKVQTAQLLLVWGEKEAVPILIDNLDNNQVMVPSEPQTSLNYYSYIILRDYTDVDFQYNKQQWQNWWNTNNNKLNWDQETEKFK